MAEKGSDREQENTEELQKRIERLESELENIKKQAGTQSNSQKTSAGKNEGFTRRKFLKSLGLGTAGLGALAFGSQAAGLRLEPDNLRTLEQDDIIEDDDGFVSIFADYLDADEIDADEITVDVVNSSDEINAEHISTDTLEANEIETDTLEANEEIETDELDAEDIQTASISTDEINNADVEGADDGEALVSDGSGNLEFQTVGGGDGDITFSEVESMIDYYEYASFSVIQAVLMHRWDDLTDIADLGWFSDAVNDATFRSAMLSDEDIIENWLNDHDILEEILSNDVFVGDFSNDQTAIEMFAEDGAAVEVAADSDQFIDSIEEVWEENTATTFNIPAIPMSPIYLIYGEAGGGGASEADTAEDGGDTEIDFSPNNIFYLEGGEGVGSGVGEDGDVNDAFGAPYMVEVSKDDRETEEGGADNGGYTEWFTGQIWREADAGDGASGYGLARATVFDNQPPNIETVGEGGDGDDPGGNGIVRVYTPPSHHPDG